VIYFFAAAMTDIRCQRSIHAQILDSVIEKGAVGRRVIEQQSLAKLAVEPRKRLQSVL